VNETRNTGIVPAYGCGGSNRFLHLLLRDNGETMCEELNKLKADAIAAFAEAKRLRRYRDLSFREDADLSSEGYRRIDALIRHLLAGHDGEPCPDGGRPIVRSAESESVKM